MGSVGPVAVGSSLAATKLSGAPRDGDRIGKRGGSELTDASGGLDSVLCLTASKGLGEIDSDAGPRPLVIGAGW